VVLLLFRDRDPLKLKLSLSAWLTLPTGVLRFEEKVGLLEFVLWGESVPGVSGLGNVPVGVGELGEMACSDEDVEDDLPLLGGVVWSGIDTLIYSLLV